MEFGVLAVTAAEADDTIGMSSSSADDDHDELEDTKSKKYHEQDRTIHSETDHQYSDNDMEKWNDEPQQYDKDAREDGMYDNDQRRKSNKHKRTFLQFTSSKFLTNYQQVPSSASTDTSTADPSRAASTASNDNGAETNTYHQDSTSLSTCRHRRHHGDGSDDDNDHNPNNDTSKNRSLLAYWKILCNYPMYRAFFIAQICQNLGDWFVEIASLLVVEAISISTTVNDGHKGDDISNGNENNNDADDSTTVQHHNNAGKTVAHLIRLAKKIRAGAMES